MSSAVSSKSGARCLLLIALVAFAGGTPGVLAQSLRCTAIRRGETATRVARRITGDARNAWESWFQIVDPVSSRFVSKATYDYVRVGWNACLTTGQTRAVAPRVDDAETTWTQRVRATYENAARAFESADSNVALWAVLLALFALATHGAGHYFRNRERVLTAMRQFSERFVQEFERPLIAPDASSPPIRSRLRFAPRAARLDILIAPGAGRRYPNLADHRRNVEYDIQRVLHILRDQPFVNGRPYMDGTWVVLPFQLNPEISQAGGT